MNEIWKGHEKMLNEPCRASLINGVIYLVEDNEFEDEYGDRIRKVFDLPIDQAVSLAKWVLEIAEYSNPELLNEVE